MKYLLMIIVAATRFYASAGELAESYLEKVRDNPNAWVNQRMLGSQQASVVATNHGITDIGIERTVCYGTCPAYTFVVKSDGSFRYVGEKYALRLGKLTGTIPTYEFERLARFIKDCDYMGLSNTYDRAVTDNPTVYTMVVVGGKKKVISDYDHSGPPKFWAVEQLIDDLMLKAQWNEPPKNRKQKVEAVNGRFSAQAQIWLIGTAIYLVIRLF